jgi:hypothetical protein
MSRHCTPVMSVNQERHEELIELLERIADALESISGKQGIIANSLLQLSDHHGSNTPGPYR